MREIHVGEHLAVQLERLRLRATRRNLWQAPKDDGPPTLRVQEIEAIEEELGVVLPDPALAYIAAGVSVWGDGPVQLGVIREKTLMVREEARAARFVVIDDDSNGNYIAVKKGTPKDSDRVYFLDHETGYLLDNPLSLSSAIDSRLEDSGVPPSVTPFRFELVDQPEPVRAAPTVRHPKFGQGTVVADDGEYVTVTFERDGTKRMKRAFLAFD